MSASKSLNCYSHHAPKLEWIIQYFTHKNDFDQNHTLGSQMFSFFKRFLRDSKLLESSGYSSFAKHVERLGLDDLRSWALMLVNLAYSPEVNWLVKRVPFFEKYSKDYVLSLLISDGAKESWVNDIWSAYSRLLDLPFSRTGLGTSIKESGRMIAIYREPWETPDPIAVLYGL